MSEENKEKEWVAPLVRRLLATPAMPDTAGPMECPVCACDHQVFQGSGCFAPSADGTKLICCFPTTRKMVEVEMPKDIQIGGLVNYVRYACQCGGHSWALIDAYHKEGTAVYCVDLSPTKCKKGNHPGKPAKPGKPGNDFLGSISQLMKDMAAGGHQPILALGPGIAEHMPKHILDALKAQGAKLIKPPGNMVPPPPPGSYAPGEPLLPDHESPLALLPATVRYAWQNFPLKKPMLEGEVFNYHLPVIPTRRVADPGGICRNPPHLACGTDDSNLFPKMQEWLFTLSVELKTESVKGILGMVYWGSLLIVVSQIEGEARTTLTKDIANGIISLNKLKPDIYMMQRTDYENLRFTKGQEVVNKKPKL